ncbi:DUF6906 family protein [Shouchella lehensis]|uniref:DUF6906 domain-containing protein n=1 Tax=Shouchella lehensis G1 TaxID=1246626 RepID=A0A060LVX9_9BACI|nr:hypothetical protein [Shouchella lehensis]AIC95411.1 hypothetical protein BleG1_2847 [Shouchella lehensis G1]
MKSGKRPTLKQKQAMLASGKSPNKWLVVKSLEDELHIVHRETGREETIVK